jgi:subtilase family serine protease
MNTESSASHNNINWRHLGELSMKVTSLRIWFAILLSSVTGLAWALSPAGSPTAAIRITEPINEANLVPAGSTLKLAAGSVDEGPVADSLPMNHLFLQLRRDAADEQALSSMLEQIQDKSSSEYHHWITAEALGERFGPARDDIATVVQWLSSNGFTVHGVSESGLTIDFSGTAAQVRDTFHAEIHRYSVNGKQHIANSSTPKIPAALASVVAGVVSLHDFMPKPLLVKPKSNFSFYCKGCPDGFNGTEQYDEAPADLATIYNVTPLYKAKKPITGKGVTVVVLEDTDVQDKDVATFRKAFGLTAYSGTFSQIHPGPGCADPGNNGAEGEAALDSEWAGAVAPDATVHLASCADTTTNFGAFIAAQNLLDEAVPPAIMSLSYLECEADIGPGPNGNGYVNGLWQQAAVEGVSVFVAAGDNGAAGCDDFDTATYAVGGIAANGLASTPYDVATGGTDFLDTSENDNAKYWTTSNSADGKSAKSYIPETPWNDSCAGSVLYEYLGYTNPITFCNNPNGTAPLDIIAGSGAPSFVYPKPYWQQGTYGMPNDGARDLPDVSLFASNGFWDHAILLCMSDAAQGGAPCDYSKPIDVFNNSAGGTSFTAPQFASIQALIDQKAGGRQGNPDPVFYDLAKREYGSAANPSTGRIEACNSSKGTVESSTCIFHDITVGNNDVVCYGTANCYDPNPNGYGVLSTSDSKLHVAYPAAAGWDFTTGLGSVNVTNLVNAWP